MPVKPLQTSLECESKIQAVVTRAKRVLRGGQASTKRYMSSAGAPFFVVKHRADRTLVVTFKVDLNDDFFEALRVDVDKRVKRARRAIRVVFTGKTP